MRLLSVVLGAGLAALAVTGCGGSGEQRTAPAQEDRLVIGPNVGLPLVIDGDRLGISSLDGNSPAEIAGPGDYRGVRYDAQGRFLYVQQAGRDPGFYRVENGLPHLAIPLPLRDPWLPAEWSPDGSRGAWIEQNGATTRLRVAEPGGEPRTLGPEGLGGFLWSADGQALLAWTTGDDLTTYIIDVTGSSAPAPAGIPVPVDWSLSGDFLFLEGPFGGPVPGKVVLVRQGGGGRRVLGKVGVPPEGPGPIFAFSPDGNWLAWDRAAGEAGRSFGLIVAATDGSGTVAPQCNQTCTGEWGGADPAWSPDGTHLAWSQDGHILIAETGVWAGRVVADGEMPRWSPDGSKIAYSRTEDDHSAMYLRASDGSGDEVKVVDLEDTRYISDQIAWSPDGSQLVVPLQVSEKSRVLSFEPETGELRQLPIPALDATTALAPDGSAILFALPEGWLLISMDGAQRRIDRSSAGAMCTDWPRGGMGALCVGSEGLKTLDIATGEVEQLLAGDIQDAMWSPDGTRAAFIRDQRLGVLDLAKGKAKTIAPDLKAIYAPNYYGTGYIAWSPDGKRIAFGDWRLEEPITQGGADVYVVDADGHNLHRLTDSPRAKHDFAFSPDGKYVAYLHSLDDGDHLKVVDAQTGAEQPVDMVTWGPTNWLGTDAILGNGYQGIAAARLDGSVQLLVAATRGCRLSFIGWANGRLFFSETCTHQGL